MRKVLFLFSLLIVSPELAFAANSRDFYGDLNVRPRLETGDMYMGIRGGVSLLNWKTEYKDESDVLKGSDNFDFKSLVGLNVFVGYQSVDKWRADVEFGYTGKYSETETEYYMGFPTEKTRFDLEVFYLTANGYYDIANGLYAGIGAGFAFVNNSIDSNVLAGSSKTNISPTGALMLGWSKKLDDKVTFDIRYRFSAYHGDELKIDTGTDTYIKAETGFILDNSLSAGIRYSF